MAQAFHWFDVNLFKRECQRIIRTSGKIFFVWNMRDMNADIIHKSYQIYKVYCPEFKGFGGGIQQDDTIIMPNRTIVYVGDVES